MQVQFSLLDRRPLGPNGMLQLCKERGLKLLCYGVVAGSLLTDRYLRSPESLVYGPLLSITRNTSAIQPETRTLH